jgi:hypothetical protein
MVEEIRQVSFNIDDNDCGNNELSTFPTTRSSLDIDYKSESVPVAAGPHSSISRINSNSNFMLSNNSEVSASGLELEECPAILKVNI